MYKEQGCMDKLPTKLAKFTYVGKQIKFVRKLF